jgi:ribosomal protein S18 acetylase RimI-like enzyme
MKLQDWRDAPVGLLAQLYESERQQSLGALQWDSAAAWREVEHARTTWGLPGLLVVDDSGNVRGMAFYVIEDDWMDLGGLASDDVRATDALLDGVLAAAEAAEVRTVRTLVHETPAAIRSGLRTRGFQVESHHYLSRPCAPASGLSVGSRGAADSRGFGRLDAATHPPHGSPGAVAGFDAWGEADIVSTAALLSRAYGAKAGALFAPHNRQAEWVRYVQNIVNHPGCGVLNSDATVMLRDDAGVRALALVTDIAPRTAHLVQLAVDPSLRRGGVGRALVGEVCDRLRGRQYDALTLLVAAGNAPARALYHAEGFRHDATFVGATLLRSPAMVRRSVLTPSSDAVYASDDAPGEPLTATD